MKIILTIDFLMVKILGREVTIFQEMINFLIFHLKCFNPTQNSMEYLPMVHNLVRKPTNMQMKYKK